MFDDEDDAEVSAQLKVNKGYAKEYNRIKSIQELQKRNSFAFFWYSFQVDEKYGDEEEDSYSGEEDSEGVLAGVKFISTKVISFCRT